MCLSEDLKKLVASLGAMEIALCRILRKEIFTAEEVYKVYSEYREKLGYPMTDEERIRMLHKAEQADAEGKDSGRTEV